MEKLDIFHITQAKDLCVLVFYKIRKSKLSKPFLIWMKKYLE